MRCLYCDEIVNKISFYSLFIEEDKLCIKCRKQLDMTRKIIERDGLKIETFYEYDGLYKSILLQYKEAGDEALKDVLTYKISDYINLRYFNYGIIFAPSSKIKIEKRGFNHLEEMFKDVSLKRVTGLKMKNELIQENRSALERYKMKDNFVYEGPRYKNILIVDDVVTTGSTLRGIYECMFSQTNNIRLLSVAYKTLQKDEKL